jgi:hypothetical protein
MRFYELGCAVFVLVCCACDSSETASGGAGGAGGSGGIAAGAGSEGGADGNPSCDERACNASGEVQSLCDLEGEPADPALCAAGLFACGNTTCDVALEACRRTTGGFKGDMTFTCVAVEEDCAYGVTSCACMGDPDGECQLDGPCCSVDEDGNVHLDLVKA